MNDKQIAGLLILVVGISILVFISGTAIVLWLLRHDYRILRERALAESRLQMATHVTLAKLCAAARDAINEDE